MGAGVILRMEGLPRSQGSSLRSLGIRFIRYFLILNCHLILDVILLVVPGMLLGYVILSMLYSYKC